MSGSFYFVVAGEYPPVVGLRRRIRAVRRLQAALEAYAALGGTLNLELASPETLRERGCGACLMGKGNPEGSGPVGA